MDVRSGKYYRVNAFVKNDDEQLFTSGNAAAVVLLTVDEDSKLSDEDRQRVAREMNLSETAFVVKDDGRPGTEFGLRWFTPEVEVSLCGHATLAAGHTVLSEGWASPGDMIRFETKSGILTVKTGANDEMNITRADAKALFMTVEFPLLSERHTLSESETGTLLGSLNVVSEDLEIVYRSTYDTVAIMRNSETVRKVEPDLEAMKRLNSRGVIVAGETVGEKTRFISRFFAPSCGIDEDPVTGSAHCALAHYFLKNGEKAIAEQVSKRGGVIHVRRQDPTVLLGGHTSIVVRGTIYL